MTTMLPREPDYSGSVNLFLERAPLTADEQHQALRDRLWRDMAAYEAAGGKITYCEPWESAEFGKPHNPANVPDPAAVFQRAAAQTKKANIEKKAAVGRARITTNHTAIIMASRDLVNRGFRATILNISRDTGQDARSVEMRIDTLVIRGILYQEGTQFLVSDNGLEYIGERAAE